ncbi:MAG: guanylate kinase [Deltaproteobacteria bacterium]|nr:MAG: guanylate kinase [Deltaproteobacteria bacterium]
MSLILRSWQPPDRGALFVVSGASGTGKTTLVKEALRRMPHVRFSVSVTTRPARSGEVDGRDYHFVTADEFARMVDDDALLEWAEVYGNRYGTPRAPVEDALARGESVLLDIDVQGARQVRRHMPEAVTIFILPPDMATIEARLRGRSTDSEAVIARRMAQARQQLQGAAEADYLVVNDDLETAHDVLQAIIVAELSRRQRRASLAARFSS